jgi:DHA1 family bicyclomycin/chloramphenicol resistance-like MFS transporter
MVGASISSHLSHRWTAQRTITIGFLLMVAAVVLNLLSASLATTGILAVIGPLVLYVLGLALMMPAITVLALDCLPNHRGTAASMQGFLQMVTNAGVVSLAIPLLNASWLNFVIGQILFLLLAVLLWFWLSRKPA